MRPKVDRERYIDWLVESTPASVRAWVDVTALRRELRADLERTLETRVHSREHRIRYAQACPVEGAVADDYRLREIELAADASVLAGIHFFKLAIGRPFVGGLRPDSCADSQRDRPRIGSAL